MDPGLQLETLLRVMVEEAHKGSGHYKVRSKDIEEMLVQFGYLPRGTEYEKLRMDADLFRAGIDEGNSELVRGFILGLSLLHSRIHDLEEEVAVLRGRLEAMK
ncbi:hypothetical protein HYR54_09520 [Candidatus Acetothermia bacterium]|nr:hypothetical protein [Candidatus Acetothermia bacterium]MBI3460174.1 hypothetical protein [Candidatus Acetothermia bacterium]